MNEKYGGAKEEPTFTPSTLHGEFTVWRTQQLIKKKIFFQKNRDYTRQLFQTAVLYLITCTMAWNSLQSCHKQTSPCAFAPSSIKHFLNTSHTAQRPSQFGFCATSATSLFSETHIWRAGQAKSSTHKWTHSQSFPYFRIYVGNFCERGLSNCVAFISSVPRSW